MSDSEVYWSNLQAHTPTPYPNHAIGKFKPLTFPGAVNLSPGLAQEGAAQLTTRSLPPGVPINILLHPIAMIILLGSFNYPVMGRNGFSV
ncbi:MAG: hypothetical protein DHS80DRAFT_32545 [Piptocephalis tieghemiana]|nr:MAG: hypothetical protein DHS80DRAFT_32545 [Piptocephalis tieghemiana]